MGRTIKRLSGLEIDEVSLVDRPANQHGLVAIAKNYQEDNMGVYDADGDEVFEEELQHGDCVYDDAGNEFIYVEDGADEEIDEYAEVGKAAWQSTFDRVAASTNKGANRGRKLTQAERAKLSARRAPQEAAYANSLHGSPNTGVNHGGRAQGHSGGRSAAINSKLTEGAMRYRSAVPNKNVRRAIHFGGPAVAATGGGAAYYNTHKSLGDEVMESLSKALTDTDRSEVIANAMDYMDDVAKRNENLENIVAQILEDRETEGFVELAKGYELPANPEDIAGVMYRASQNLPAGDVAMLDRMFSSMSDVNKSSFEELGYSGGYESDMLSQIYAAAGEVVSKSGAEMTQEQAVTALFGANTAAYDEYEAEQRLR